MLEVLKAKMVYYILQYLFCSIPIPIRIRILQNTNRYL